MEDHAMCNSQRVIDGEQICCVRPHGHPGTRHRAILPDLTTIEWTGAASVTIQPQKDS